jgi:hypothetical protein
MKQISDYLFLGSLAFLIITFLIFFLGRGGANNSDIMSASGAITDFQLKHDHKETIRRQDNKLVKLLKSYLFWIPIIGITVSIILSEI